MEGSLPPDKRAQTGGKWIFLDGSCFFYLAHQVSLSGENWQNCLCFGVAYQGKCVLVSRLRWMTLRSEKGVIVFSEWVRVESVDRSRVTVFLFQTIICFCTTLAGCLKIPKSDSPATNPRYLAPLSPLAHYRSRHVFAVIMLPFNQPISAILPQCQARSVQYQAVPQTSNRY